MESDFKSGDKQADRELLIYCPDLMFASRVQNLARHAGVKSSLVHPGQARLSGDMLIASYGSGPGWQEAICAAAKAGIPAVAFGPHVDSESRRAARAAGAVRVLTNSNLDRELPPLLSDLVAGNIARVRPAGLDDPDD